MVSTAFPETLAAPPEQLRAPPTGPLLIATDGSDASDAAFAFARRIVEHNGSDAVAVAILERLPLLAHEVETPDWVKELNATRHEELALRTKRQIRKHGSPEWEVEVREGVPAIEIARAARESHATLVLVGIGSHTLRDRLFGDETALQLLRLSDVPVLAVPSGFETLPHRVVMATDFSEASIRAMRGMLPLIREDATLYLAHVVPRFAHLSGIWAAMQQSYLDRLGVEFARVRERLQLPATMNCETITLKGNPPHEILDFAEASKADLIVCGSHGQGMISRLLLGSVATYILRGAMCPVLVVPERRAVAIRHAPGARRMRDPNAHSVDLPKREWAERLELFTQRNAGRFCRIEVDDPSLGAQAQVLDYPLLGAAYDRHDDRVEIMVGERDGAHHLTRGISNVTAMSLLVDANGRDRMLHLSHGSGQTMVWLETRT